MGLQIQRNWAERPLGMRDVYPQQAKLRRQLENKLLHRFEEQGYELVSSGTVEYVDTLLRGRGLQDAEDWIQLFSANGRAIALRPEMTPSIARMAAPLLASGHKEVRWCYAERVFHRSNDPASLSWVSGKAAESTQVGVEWIGGVGPEVDCDLLTLCQGAATAVGLSDTQLVISHAVFAAAFLEALGTAPQTVAALLQCLTQGDYVGFRERLEGLDTPHDVLDSMARLNPFAKGSLSSLLSPEELASEGGVRARAAWEELVSLAESLERRGLDKVVTFDLTLHRDLTYYTGIVFELFAPGVGAPVALGGRYDDLLTQFGAPAPAIGFTFEVERLIGALTDGAWAQEVLGEGR